MPAVDNTSESTAETPKKPSVVRRARDLVANWTAPIGRQLDTPGKKAGGAVAGAVVIGAAAWFAFYKPQLPPDEQLRQALELLKDQDDLSARQQARELALELSRAGYRDPDFPGGSEFVLGIVAFRTAREADEMRKEYYFTRAARRLRESEGRAVVDAYRPEWSYALGVSLHELGNASAAWPLLKEALATFRPGRNDAAMRLIEITLELKSTAELRGAVTLAAGLLRDRGLSRRDRDRVLLDKAQLHLALNQYVEAQQALDGVSDIQAGSHAARVFRARTQMATADTYSARPGLSVAVDAVLRARAVRHYRAALSDLEAVADTSGLETTFPRQARLLMGICAQRIAEVDSGGERAAALDGSAAAAPSRAAAKYDIAINYFEQTARDYPHSHEAVAASLRSGELLRLSGRDEEALKAYRRALQTAARSDEYHNRWISHREFQAALLRAWNDWMDRRSFSMAIQLSGMMSPIIAKPREQELNALAHAEWARQLAAVIATRPASERPALRREVLRRRRLAGKSYAKLAELVKASGRYAGYLKLSAEYYHAGHEFENALKQLTGFINTRPERELARAIVRRGRVLMDLDRLREALDEFRRVRHAFPKDPATFEALYLSGACQLELGRPKQAEAVWNDILSSGQLTPDAIEWRLSLFSLGRHLFQTAKILMEDAARVRRTDVKKSRELREAAAARFETAVARLDEYLSRYPGSKETDEVRFLIAKALQCGAAIEDEKRAEGEVENVRNEHRRRRDALLRRAILRYRLLQSDLLKLEETDRLEAAGQSLLRDCYFEIAHATFALDEFDKAALAYTNAANRYSKDAQVLLAYLQLANCSDRLGDPAEAMSLIIQAEVILKQLPETAFDRRLTGMTRAEWTKWLQWTRRRRAALLK
jgi:tetratricopeptide (TPR) repeat protein